MQFISSIHSFGTHSPSQSFKETQTIRLRLLPGLPPCSQKNEDFQSKPINFILRKVIKVLFISTF